MQAAERRARDDKACGFGALAEREAAKAATDGIEHNVIDLTIDANDTKAHAGDVIIVDQKHPAARPLKDGVPRSEAPSSKSIRDYAVQPAQPSNGHERIPASRRPNALLPTNISGEWSCPTCTLLNQPQALQCNACLAERPPYLSASWICMTCGEAEMPHNLWICRFCGVMKTAS